MMLQIVSRLHENSKAARKIQRVACTPTDMNIRTVLDKMRQLQERRKVKSWATYHTYLSAIFE